jgi:hypothetical protein
MNNVGSKTINASPIQKSEIKIADITATASMPMEKERKRRSGKVVIKAWTVRKDYGCQPLAVAF